MEIGTLFETFILNELRALNALRLAWDGGLIDG